jgi:hypothetical protein
VKLRVRGNSLRLRLGQGEVRRLVAEGFVEERTEFAPGEPAFAYEVRVTDDPGIAASYEGGRITVSVPRATARQWAAGGQVGLEGSQPAGGEPLRILIEKDFKCLDATPGESQDDAFPNPRGSRC